MSCIITYKGKKYSEEQFKEYFINNKQEFATSIAKNKDVIDSFKRKMEGIDFVFSQSPELASIGSKAQYLQYLSTIFPDSKVKDIVYHGTPDGRFESFDISKAGKTTYQPTKGIYFTDSKKTADFYAEGSVDFGQFESREEYEAVKTAKVFSVILNAKELKLVDDPQAQEKQGDAILRTKNKIDDSGFIGEPDFAHQYLVFEPKQIHILGTKQDIEGFKNFVSTQPTSSVKPTIDLSREWSEDLKTRPVYTLEGVNTMRTEAAKPTEHFGNPFSEAGYGDTIKVGSVAEAAEAYKTWLLMEVDFTSPFYEKYLNKIDGLRYNELLEQRAWIINQINQGKLDNANLLYAGKLAARGQGSHAEKLVEVVKILRADEDIQAPVSQTNKPKGIQVKEGIYVNQGALTKEEQLELFDYLKPYLEEQAAKTNKGANASKMIGLGLRWDYKNNNTGRKAIEISDAINPGNKTKYGYYRESINGQPLGQITPRFRELMQKATGVDMKYYDGAIINLYEKDTFISSHNDVDESRSAIKYPVIGINIGGKGNFSIERLGSENAMLDLQAGTAYVFGVDGINREVWHRTFPTPQDSFLPQLTTKIDGKTYPAGSYRITITMRRVLPLALGVPKAPSIVSTSTQPTVEPLGINKPTDIEGAFDEKDLHVKLSSSVDTTLTNKGVSIASLGITQSEWNNLSDEIKELIKSQEIAYTPNFNLLKDVSGVNEHILAAEIKNWQDIQGVDYYPSLTDLNIENKPIGLLSDSVAKETMIYLENLKALSETNNELKELLINFVEENGPELRTLEDLEKLKDKVCQL